MLFDDIFHTLASASQGLFKEKGSKFLSFAFPVKNETEIKGHLEKLKKSHPGANHICYAFIIGPQGIIHKTSDDGEPSGTAGKPILNAMKSKGLTDILIAVVRYFGGTLLGTRGLIDAYKAAALDAITNNTIIEKTVSFRFMVHFPDSQASAMHKLLKDFKAEIMERNYSDEHVYHISIRKSLSDTFEEKVKELYPCKIQYLL
jgi:uncharacterized YigZ family protein